jgi:hypothetical protein
MACLPLTNRLHYDGFRPWLVGCPMQFDPLKSREFVTPVGGVAATGRNLAARCLQPSGSARLLGLRERAEI